MNNQHNKLTQIPPDIDYFPQEHIISILRVVVAERDELFMALQNEQAKTANAAAAAAAAPTQYPIANDAFGFPYPAADANEHHHNLSPTVAHNNHNIINNHNNNDNTMNMAHHHQANSNSIPSTFKVDLVKKRIAKKSFTLVKKTAHKSTTKPYTEINEAVPTAASAMALFEGFDAKSDTSRLMRWELTGDQAVAWLGGANKYIHPVKFDGKNIAFGVGSPKAFVYAWASYVSLQAKYDKKGASLWLKFRTKMVGSGRPAEGSDIPPSFS